MNYTTFGNGLRVEDWRHLGQGWSPYLRYGGYISTLVIHHTATGRELTPEQLAEAHLRRIDPRSGEAWKGPAYHFMVYFRNWRWRIAWMVPLEFVSWHTAGNNYATIGLAFAGHHTERAPTAWAVRKMAHLLDNVCFELGDHLRINPHRTYVNTECPGPHTMSALWEVLSEEHQVYKNNRKDNHGPWGVRVLGM